MKPLVVGYRTRELPQIQHAPNHDDQCGDSYTDLEHASHYCLKALIFSMDHSQPPCQSVEDHFNPQRNNDNTEYQAKGLDIRINQDARANERPGENA
jgi:hypothetical protein